MALLIGFYGNRLLWSVSKRGNTKLHNAIEWIIPQKGGKSTASDVKFTTFLEFYNRDKGRKALNLTEKYKNKSAGNKGKVRPAERENENAVSGYWRWTQSGRVYPEG